MFLITVKAVLFLTKIDKSAVFTVPRLTLQYSSIGLRRLIATSLTWLLPNKIFPGRNGMLLSEGSLKPPSRGKDSRRPI